MAPGDLENPATTTTRSHHDAQARQLLLPSCEGCGHASPTFDREDTKG